MASKAAPAVAAPPAGASSQDAPPQTKLPLSMLTPKNGNLGAWAVCIACPVAQGHMDTAADDGALKTDSARKCREGHASRIFCAHALQEAFLLQKASRLQVI